VQEYSADGRFGVVGAVEMQVLRRRPLGFARDDRLMVSWASDVRSLQPSILSTVVELVAFNMMLVWLGLVRRWL
jgi:hypothetical protein